MPPMYGLKGLDQYHGQNSAERAFRLCAGTFATCSAGLGMMGRLNYCC